MIGLVHIKGFKALRDLKTQLGKLTLLAGPNACGKTSFLEALHVLGQLRKRDPQRVFVGRFAPETLITKHAERLEVRVQAMVGTGRAHCRVRPSPETQHSESRWRMDHDVPQYVFPVTRLAEFRMADLSEPAAREETFGDSGRGLSAFLATLKVTAPEAFERLIGALRQVIPTVKDVRFESVDVDDSFEELVDEFEDTYRKRSRSRPGFQLKLEMVNDFVVPSHAASEGTLLTLGLLAVVAQEAGPKLMLLDNIDAGLHPRAAQSLVEQVRKLMAADPELQIVATTHSPYLLDHVEPKEIRLMCSDDAGHAVIGSLTEHPEFDRWKDEMLPGEFWSTVGENWLKQRPAPAA